MNQKLIVFCLLILCCSTPLLSQSYGASMGLRLGNNSNSRTIGLTGQYRLAKYVTLEGIVQSDFRHNTTGHLMIERHRRILSKRLNFYIGTGFSIGTEQSEFKEPSTNTIQTTYGNNTMGVDLIVGAETTMLGYNVSVDYKPNFNLVNREPWINSQVGISLRQVVIKNRAQNKRKRKRERSKKKKEREKKRKDEEPWFRDWYQTTFKNK